MVASMSRTGDEALHAFVAEVAAALQQGKLHRTPGLGTFTTCSRKAAPGRDISKMAIFRASAEFRAYASGGQRPSLSGPHAKALGVVVEAMRSAGGVDVPLLGRMAIVPVPHAKPKIIFHAAQELNDALALHARQELPCMDQRGLARC